jgi:hypothetical protein
MISCREAARLSSKSLEQPLLFWERVALRFHLSICTVCTHYHDQVLFLHDLFACIRNRPEAFCLETGICLSPECKARIKKALSS